MRVRRHRMRMAGERMTMRERPTRGANVPERGRGLVLHGVDGHPVLKRRDDSASAGGAAFEHIAAAGKHGIVVEPDEMRRQLIRHQRCGAHGQHVAAADIDLVGQGER